MKHYSLRKSKKILISVYHLWRRKKKGLLPAQVTEIQNDLKAFQEEVLKKNREGADYMAHKCLDYSNGILKKSFFEQIRDFVFQLVFALVVALLIRQMWFELYTIPTGSMRPTFEELDTLVVSKTDFGINIPFSTKHLYFDPSLAKRAGIVVFTVADLDVHDPDTMYFWLFPGKKQFVKRMMGLPGDTLYFYGGKIYGIDKNGRDISDQLQLPSLDKIDHVPIIRFDGNMTLAEPFRMAGGIPAFRTAIVHQMNEPIARLSAISGNRLEGELLHTPQIHDRNSPMPSDYWQLWGIGNYGKVRIVDRGEIRNFSDKYNISLGDEKYFLQIRHHPSLNYLKLAKDWHGRLRPQFALNTSILGLDEDHMKTMFENLYTARFVVRNGYMMPWMAGGKPTPQGRHHFLARLDGVPDGTYEYYYGQAYQVNWGGLLKKLDQNHPLMRYSSDLLVKMFNFGIEFDKRFLEGNDFYSGRYTYFRNGDLFLMGAPIFKVGEPALEKFVAREKEWQENSHSKNPHSFLDTGPPLNENGQLDVEKIRKYGLLIPPKSYLALGDNFSNSGDSREFGFVPQGNLRGGPSFIFWPLGKRFGPPNQPSYPWLTIPNVIVWLIALICFSIWFIFHRRHHVLPLKDL